MDKATKQAIEATTEMMAVAYKKAFEIVNDQEEAINIAHQTLIFVDEMREQTRPNTPSVDDVIAGLRESMQKEHGKEGKK